jgi:hypothetical protein
VTYDELLKDVSSKVFFEILHKGVTHLDSQEPIKQLMTWMFEHRVLSSGCRPSGASSCVRSPTG